MKSKKQIQKRIERLTEEMDRAFDDNSEFMVETVSLFASEIHALEWVLNEA